ncbi:hypothetical protein M8C21_017050 [Ambrosia artemisiifolia]|uniref:Uncharacterized protein n=1 Tax=Ambrosia artemisiifolia TaxID=4212 RepID=A0AAD5CBW6_AMBAR|nr:hypothetical protein M8C21_017050 [Ambrosia artemisiifolia]
MNTATAKKNRRVFCASIIRLGIGSPVKISVPPINLPKVEKLPPYTTWIFLVSRRRIYYARNGGEALICSDSEEENLDDKDEKKEFVKSEDNIIRSTIEQNGSSDFVYDLQPNACLENLVKSR